MKIALVQRTNKEVFETDSRARVISLEGSGYVIHDIKFQMIQYKEDIIYTALVLYDKPPIR